MPVLGNKLGKIKQGKGRKRKTGSELKVKGKLGRELRSRLEIKLKSRNMTGLRG